MDIQKYQKLTKNKSSSFIVRINPNLLKILDDTIKPDFDNRNSFVETSILQYLESKGKL